MLIAVSIGGVLLSATYGSAMAMYRFSAGGENRVLASTMAQQVIDNARNARFDHLRDDLLGNNATVTQVLNLYDYPANPKVACFPRPLLRDSNLTYSTAAVAKQFNGTVKETLVNLIPGEMNNGLIRVNVLVEWDDTQGHHTYKTGTTISQTGIHN